MLSCASRQTLDHLQAAGRDIIGVGITVNGPGRYAGGLEVSRAGVVKGGDIDGTPNPFVHEYKRELRKETTDSIFDLAETVLRRDPGKAPIIDKSNIVYITIKTSDGKWHTYFRGLTGSFDMSELKELDYMLKAIGIGLTVHWP